jgi:hypothetical protein
MDTAAAEEKPWLDLPDLPGVPMHFPDLPGVPMHFPDLPCVPDPWEDMVRRCDVLRGPVVEDEDDLRMARRLQILRGLVEDEDEDDLKGPKGKR